MSERFFDILNRFSECRVGVIGDFVADEYILGITSRVSREAPVLILRYDSEEILPGGAANAVYNINALGGNVFPIGAIGDDDSGSKLVSMLNDCGIDTKGILRSPLMVTPTKTRILAGGETSTKQQVIRIDKENNTWLNEDLEKKIFNLIDNNIDKFDALLVSDYSLGTVTESVIKKINKISKKGKKVITVDSRYNLLKFRDVTAVTPNSEEFGWACDSMNVKCDEKAGFSILNKIRSGAVLLTKGKNGMSVYENKKLAEIDIYGTDEIADVTGAGDTVISAFTLSLACGASFLEASKIANYAGGIVVTKARTATVTVNEIGDAIKKDEKS